MEFFVAAAVVSLRSGAVASDRLGGAARLFDLGRARIRLGCGSFRIRWRNRYRRRHRASRRVHSIKSVEQIQHRSAGAGNAEHHKGSDSAPPTRDKSLSHVVSILLDLASIPPANVVAASKPTRKIVKLHQGPYQPHRAPKRLEPNNRERAVKVVSSARPVVR